MLGFIADCDFAMKDHKEIKYQITDYEFNWSENIRTLLAILSDHKDYVKILKKTIFNLQIT